MTHGPERGLLAGRAEGELVQIGLADDDRAGLAQPRDDWRVRARDSAAARADPAVVGVPATSIEILHRHRDAVQRAEVVAGADLRLRGARVRQGPSRITVMNALSSGRASMRARQRADEIDRRQGPS